MPAYPTEDYVRPILEPHEARLSGIFHRAWARLSKNPDRASFEFDRTVAVVMHQFTMLELRAEYAEVSGAHLWEEHETIRLLLDRRVMLRLKKMDENGVTRASPTQSALAFITPMAPLPFTSADFPDPCSVDCGYVLNDLGTRIDHVLIAARNGDAVLWSYAIDRAAPTTATFTLPHAPASPSSPASIITVPDVGGADRKKTRD